jgi:hypothetical protein
MFICTRVGEEFSSSRGEEDAYRDAEIVEQNLLIIGYAVAHSERNCGKTLVLYSLQCSLIIKCKLRLLCAEAVRIGRITTILPN